MSSKHNPATDDDEPELTPAGRLAIIVSTPMGLLIMGLAVIAMGVCMHYLPSWEGCLKGIGQCWGGGGG